MNRDSTPTQLTLEAVTAPPVVDGPEPDAPPPPPDLAIEVIRSTRRRKTVEARLVGDTLEIRMPVGLDAAEEREFIENFRVKFERKRWSGHIDLARRADQLAAELGLSRPRSIRWVSNQQKRWGSCTPVDGSIRISDRLAECPRWVLDYVIVHELAHLDVADHGPRFQALVARYPRAERAIGFLIARGWDGH